MQAIPLKNSLSQPQTPPRFSVKLKDSEKKEFILADPRATRALLACMDMTAVLNGAASHWGGPAGFAEIFSALYALVFAESNQGQIPWFERFHLINDTGHCENGLYALKANYGMAGLSLEKLKKFRSIESPLTGHGEAHLFPEGVYLSNGPLGSTLGQAQGLSLADKMQGKERLCTVTLSDGALMEGEVKECLSALPGFAKKGKLNPFLLILSDNNTKLSGRIDRDSFSMEPTFQSLKSLGWNVISVEKGNDLQTVFLALQKGFKEAWDNPLQPVALWIKTVKGFGVKATEESSSGGHGFPLKDSKDLADFLKEIYQGDEVPEDFLKWQRELEQFKPKKSEGTVLLEKTQAGISKALVLKKREGLPLVSITSDLPGSTGVAKFQKTFPESSFDMGVAEANMISVAAGFSKQGFIPVVDTFAQFAVTKGALPLIMSSLSQAPVIGIFSHIGFQDAADGASHQSLSYFAKTCSLPKTRVYCLSCSEEAFSLVSQVVEEFYQMRKKGEVPPSTLFFLGRETFPKHFAEGTEYHLKKAQILLDYSKGENPILIVTCGPLVREALKAGEELKAQGQGVVVINNPLVSEPDTATLSHWLKKCQGRVLTLEEHQLKGGFSSQVVLSLKKEGVSINKFKALGLNGQIGRSAYKAVDLYQFFGLDSAAVQKAVKEMVR
ncbi:MAG: transketolase [Bdellovibrionales bacterium]|nr:transketolase [Bdellovibrionales bacterium]